MNVKTIIILLLSFILNGCNEDVPYNEQIQRAEYLLESEPDSSYFILDNIDNPERMSNKLFAHWCLLYGEAADKSNNEMPYVSQLERSQRWFQRNGTPEEQVQIGLYLARSCIEDKEYQKAMATLLSIFDLSQEHKLYNLSAYICSYIGDLLQNNNDIKSASDKYIEAASLFLQANNKRSYALALRDAARQYAYLELYDSSLVYLNKADSVAQYLSDKRVRGSILNGIGNIYRIENDEDNAIKYLLLSTSLDSVERAPSLINLIEIYVGRNELEIANKYLTDLRNSTNDIESIAHCSYLIAKARGDMSKALYFLEQYQEKADSAIVEQSDAYILDIEKKYNHVKVQEENYRLKIIKQRYFVAVVFISAFFLLLALMYQLYRKKTNLRIHQQQEDLHETKIKILNLSIELEKSKQQLGESLLANEEEITHKVQDIKAKEIYIEHLRESLHAINKERLLNSSIGKKLIALSTIPKPDNTKSLITSSMWKSIVNEVSISYPSFKSNLLDLCPDLSDTDWEYCCLLMFDLDSNSEAILLNIIPESVRKRRLRIRQRLGIPPASISLYKYFTIESINV